MKRDRLRSLRRWVFLMVLGPPAFWGLVLGLMPTDWARRRVEAELSAAAGQPCTLNALRLGPFGDVQLRGLELAEEGREHDPWIRAESVRIDIRLIQLLYGYLQPTDIRASGVTMRVCRQAGGAFEFNGLLRTDNRNTSARSPNLDAGATADDCEVRFRLADSRLTVLDEPTGTRLEFTELQGHGFWRRSRASLAALTGQLNGGEFALEASLERGSSVPMFEGELHARRVALGEGMRVLEYITPMLAGASSALDGRMDLNLYLRGQGDTTDELSRSLVGQGAVHLEPIRLDQSYLISELGRVLAMPPGARLGSVKSDFAIANRRVLSKNLTLEVAGVPIVLTGGTDFDGRVDYRIRCDAMAERVSPELQEIFAELPMSLDKLLELRIQGTSDAMLVTLDGVPIGGDTPISGREHLRGLGRRLRDRVLR